MLATSGAFTSRKLQRQAMRGGRRVGGGGTGRKTTGRVRALRRTRSAQVWGFVQDMSMQDCHQVSCI